MSIANLITLSRILLTPLFVCFYLEGEQAAAMLLLGAAALSDMLDGFVARHFDMVTPLGKVLDPVADKLLQLAMLLCLIKRSHWVPLILMLHILRELGLFLLGIAVYKRCSVLIGARWYGKLCTALMYGFLGAALLWREMPEEIFSAGIIGCTGLIVYCLCRYAGEYIRLLRDDKIIKKPT